MILKTVSDLYASVYLNVCNAITDARMDNIIYSLRWKNNPNVSLVKLFVIVTLFYRLYQIIEFIKCLNKFLILNVKPHLS